MSQPTALNYDLMRAGNHSLSEEDKRALTLAAFDQFVVPQHLEYMESLVAATNPGNLVQVFRGLHEVPEPWFKARARPCNCPNYWPLGWDEGLKVVVWDTSGSINTPRYGEEYDDSHHQTDMQYQVVLEFPEDMEELVGDGRLVVELEVDTREDTEGGWQEWVEFIEGPKYNLFFTVPPAKNWTDANALCMSKSDGGNLASILSWEENAEAKVAMKLSPRAWIGANHFKEEKVWVWTDNSTFDFETFAFRL